MKEITNNLDLFKSKNFCSVKENTKRIRKHVTDWKKIFETHTHGMAQIWTPPMLDRVWSNSNPHTFPVEMKIIVTLED